MTDLSNTLNLINYAFVLFFGYSVSLYLADIPFRGHHRLYILSYLDSVPDRSSFTCFWGRMPCTNAIRC